MPLYLFIRNIWQTRDASIFLVLIPLAAACLWTNLLPINATVRQAALERFHLATPTFTTWAIQQPIPAMYHFENTCQVYGRSPQGEPANLIQQKTLNHFPTRYLTCADQRGVTDEPRYVRLRSCYQGTTVSTDWTMIPDSSGKMVLTREPSR